MDNPLKQAWDKIVKVRALANAYRKVFSTQEGRLVLEDLMSVSGITRGVRSANPEKAIQYEAVRLFVFGILKKTGLKQQQIVESVYAKVKEIADGPTGTQTPPEGAEAMSVTHSFSMPAPEEP